jgi:hypothetical protein
MFVSVSGVVIYLMLYHFAWEVYSISRKCCIMFFVWHFICGKCNNSEWREILTCYFTTFSMSIRNLSHVIPDLIWNPV